MVFTIYIRVLVIIQPGAYFNTSGCLVLLCVEGALSATAAGGGTAAGGEDPAVLDEMEKMAATLVLSIYSAIVLYDAP